MVLDLTVRVGQILEGAIADGDAVPQPALHLAVKQDLRHFVLVKVLLLVLGDEHYPSEVVHMAAVLPDHGISLLSLHGQD